MDQSERLSYYKRLIADGKALTEAQTIDMDLIVRERGIASSAALPSGGALETEAQVEL